MVPFSGNQWEAYCRNDNRIVLVQRMPGSRECIAYVSPPFATKLTRATHAHFLGPPPHDAQSTTLPTLQGTHAHLVRPISRSSDEARHRGVFCGTVFSCKWGACTAVFGFQGSYNAANDAEFQDKIHVHIKTHAFQFNADGTRACKWKECRASGMFQQAQSMERHIKTHIPWWVFCEHCDGIFSRADQRKGHEKACEAYENRKAGGSVPWSTIGNA